MQIVHYQLLYQHHGRNQRAFGPLSLKYSNSIIYLPFCQFYKKVVLRLSEHGDAIETQTIKVCQQTRSLVFTVFTSKCKIAPAVLLPQAAK